MLDVYVYASIDYFVLVHIDIAIFQCVNIYMHIHICVHVMEVKIAFIIAQKEIM